MSFDISRLRRADQIVGGSAIALFIFMFFFKWYGVSSERRLDRRRQRERQQERLGQRSPTAAGSG